MKYDHTQRSPINLLLHLPAAIAFFAAWLIQDIAFGAVVLLIGVVLLVVSLCFQTLRVTGQDEYLDVRFGLLNWFGTRIAYRDITHVEPGQTSLIDGWGIHFIPFRGWTLNLSGFECVKISRGAKVIQIGTDDSAQLVRFLEEQMKRVEQPAA